VRFDWRIDSQGVPKLLEVNPNPGWCWDGHLAKMAALLNINYANMLHEILRATENRIAAQLQVNNQIDKQVNSVT
jgi:D-alanine-D-alanine ligase